MVGCGFFSQFQVAAWLRMPDVELVGLCDADPAKAERFGVGRLYTDLAAMLDAEKPDFLDIVTRPEQHLPMARTAAERGFHVLCQKPFAPTLEEAREIVGACRNVRLMVNENWRFQAWYREIKGLLDTGAIGEPFGFRFVHRANDGLLDPPYPNQPYFSSYPKFLIYETLVHYLDTSRYLFGELSVAACATARVNPKIAGEDLALITLRGEKIAGVIDGNRCSPLDELGEAMGNLRIDGIGGTLWLAADGRITVEPRGGVRREHSYSIPTEGYRGDSCYNTQRHFIECLLSGREFETNGPDYLKSMQLVEDCYAKAR
jgi:predicted dehydrogenase